MTAQTNQPAKFLVPFAQNDTSRVEIPVTTSDATRASQSAGFPPLTMQPPETGGVPPQGEDFNGAMNQVARIAWWLMLGGQFAFDNAFATATQIGGYPKGALLQGADAAGTWLNTTDNNTTNPDTSTDAAGGGYVPAFQYGTTALTGLTGGTVTLTNAQAAKATLTLAGTLTSALTLLVPTWLKGWTVTNNTTGAFAVTVKTAAGTGVVIPQNGAPTPIAGDGTNITQPSNNIPAGTQLAQGANVAQVYAGGPPVGTGTDVFAQRTTPGTTITYTASEFVLGAALGGQKTIVSNLNATLNLATTGAGGMDNGAAPTSGAIAVYVIYNPTTQVAALLAQSITVKPSPVYTGAYRPSGYTVSGLIAILGTNGSAQIGVVTQIGRKVSVAPVGVLGTATDGGAQWNAQSFSGVAPPGGKTVSGYVNASSTASGSVTLNTGVGADSNGTGNQTANDVQPAGGGASMQFTDIPLDSSQRAYLYYHVSSGSPSSVFWQFFGTAYTF